MERRPLRARDLPIWVPLARLAGRLGISPNAISALGLAFGLAGGLALAYTEWATPGWCLRLIWLTAVVLIMLRGSCNVLDGVLAVETGVASPLGQLWNEIPDRISDAATLMGAGYAVGGSPAAGWAAALVAVFVAYTRAQSRAAGAPMDYCGPMAKPARMGVIAAAAVYSAITPLCWQPGGGGDGRPGAMSIALILVIAGGLITAVRRLRHAAHALRQASP